MKDSAAVDQVLRDLLGSRPRGTQAELARSLGVRPQTVTKWLNGSVTLPVRRWLDVERALGAEPLTIARRVGLLADLPGFEDIPPDRLDAVWARTFAQGEARSEAEASDRAAWTEMVRRRLTRLEPLLARESMVGREILAGLRLGVLRALQQHLHILTAVMTDGEEVDPVGLRILRQLADVDPEFSDLIRNTEMNLAGLRAAQDALKAHEVYVSLGGTYARD